MKRKTRTKKLTSNQRIDVAPEGGALARLGFYASPVQKVVYRWRDRLRAEWLEGYFAEIATAVSCKNHRMELKVAVPSHWLCVAELFAAVTKVFSDKTKPAYWLLTLPICVSTDGDFDKWPAVRQTIIENGGTKFSTEVLSQAAKRLKLLTPPKMARDFLATRPSFLPQVKLAAMTKHPGKMS